MTLPEDVHSLIEEYIDNEADPLRWQQARAEFGALLDEALAKALARRAAIASLTRPVMPQDLRIGIASRARPPTKRSIGLFWGLPLLATAALLVLLWTGRHDPARSQPDDGTRELALLQETPAPSELMERPESAVLGERRQPMADEAIAPEPRSRAETSMAMMDIDEESLSEPASEPMPMDAVARDEQELGDEEEAIAALHREALAFREDIVAGASQAPVLDTADRRSRRAKPAADAPSGSRLAAVMQLLTTVDGERHLLLVFHNGGDRRLAGRALELRLEGLDGAGRVVWSEVPAALDTLLLDPDQSHSMSLQLGRDIDPPASVTALRLAFGVQHGEVLELDADSNADER